MRCLILMSNHSSFFWESLGRVYGGLTDTETKNNLIEYVWGQMRINGERSAPVLRNLNESRFITSRKARIRYDELQKLDGYLNIAEDGFVIVLNKDLRRTPLRLRTVIAHEIGHTFLFDTESAPIKPLCPIEDSQAHLWETHEGLAYEIGRNILVPRQILKEYSYLSPSIDSFFKLKRLFQTTSTVLARQLVHGGFWNVYIFWTNLDQKSSDYEIPKRNCRFKSKKSFRNFNLDLHWKNLRERIAGQASANFVVKLGRKNYVLEARRMSNSCWTICMLKPEIENL